MDAPSGHEQPRIADEVRPQARAAAGPPAWLGIPFLAVGVLSIGFGVAAATGSLPQDWSVSGDPIIAIAVGAVFSLGGAGLAWTSLRARRLRAAAPRPATEPGIGALDTARFTRSPMRMLVDLVLTPVGGLAFLGFAVVLLRHGGVEMAFAILPAFFGSLLLLASLVSVRRGTRLEIGEVGPEGLWIPELGRLSWSGIGQVRVEESRGISGAYNRGTAVYRRLGIVPRDPDLARRAPGGPAAALAGAYVRMLNRIRPDVDMSDPGARAPFGIEETELEQPFEDLIRSVERYAPVANRPGREGRLSRQ